MDEEEFAGAKAAAVFYDLGTDELCIEPAACRTTENTTQAVRQFKGPTFVIKSMYCDNAPELRKAFFDCGILQSDLYAGSPGNERTC